LKISKERDQKKKNKTKTRCGLPLLPSIGKWRCDAGWRMENGDMGMGRK